VRPFRYDRPLRDLLEKAGRYLRSAELLRTDGDYDSAASRLYYAMFYCAEALLFSKGLSYSSHRGVIAAFARHFAKTGELPPDMHRWLLGAFHLRQQGDYRAVPMVTEEQVRDLQAKADEFLRLAEAYRQTRGASQ
jgi:uncharacterized protein (UPF0332 family)